MAVGVLGYTVQIASFGLLVHGLGVSYVVAAVIAGGLALLNNFVLNRHWTFEAAHGQLGRQARAYLLISAFFFAAQVAVLHLLVVAGMPKVPAEALSVLVIVPGNFVAQRRFAFSHPDRRQERLRYWRPR